MRIALSYSAVAGNGVSLERLLRRLARHGHEVVRVVEKPEQLPWLLDEEPELVLAAGGDGTVAAAADAIAGSGVPLAVLPLGTANNIAGALGCGGAIDDRIRHLARACRRPFDVGMASGPWGERQFVESAGGGLVARAIAAIDDRAARLERGPDTLASAAFGFLETLAHLRPSRWTITLDGTEIAGEFLLVEVLNIRSIGPNLVLSPAADPSDGCFTVVLATTDDREALAHYLWSRAQERSAQLTLPSWQARHVVLQSEDDVHLDDEVIGAMPLGGVSLRVAPAALEFLVPPAQARANRRPSRPAA